MRREEREEGEPSPSGDPTACAQETVSRLSRETSGGNEYCARTRTRARARRARRRKKEQRTGPLESMRMLRREREETPQEKRRRRGTKGQKAGGERSRDRKRETARVRVTGAAPSNESDEDGRMFLPFLYSMRESEKVEDGGGVPITSEGGHDGDRGPEPSRAHALRAWERALMPRAQTIPCPLFRARRSFSLLSVSLAPRLASARALSSILYPFCSLPKGSATYHAAFVLLLSSRCGDARSKAPRARCYSFRGAQYLGDRQCK